MFLTGCVRKSELARAESEVAALQEKVRLLEQQRVPRTVLDHSRAEVAAANERLAALAQELAVTREQLTGVQVQMVAAQERALALERRAVSPDAKVPESSASAGLAKGTYTVKDGDTLVYSRDAQLNFANGVTITSPSGLMLSDKDREIVAGDLVVEAPRPPPAPAAGTATTEKPAVLAERPAGGK